MTWLSQCRKFPSKWKMAHLCYILFVTKEWNGVKSLRGLETWFHQMVSFLSFLYWQRYLCPKWDNVDHLVEESASFPFVCHVQLVALCRSAASLLRDSTSTSYLSNSEIESENADSQLLGTSDPNFKADIQADQRRKQGFWFPFGDWFSHPWSKQHDKLQSRSDRRCHLIFSWRSWFANKHCIFGRFCT